MIYYSGTQLSCFSSREPSSFPSQTPGLEPTYTKTCSCLKFDSVVVISLAWLFPQPLIRLYGLFGFAVYNLAGCVCVCARAHVRVHIHSQWNIIQPLKKETLEFLLCRNSAIKKGNPGIPVVSQWVNDLACLCGGTCLIPSLVRCIKDPALLQLWCRSQLWPGFDPRSGTFHMPWLQPKKKKKEEKKKKGKSYHL